MIHGFEKVFSPVNDQNANDYQSFQRGDIVRGSPTH